MSERKVVDFEKAKGSHVHAKKETRVKKMRAAFRAARKAVAPKKLSLRKRRKNKGKKKK